MKLRIISGKLGGRQFNAPPGHKTHPMSDRARGALFNILGDIEGLTVLDAFAGSGALGFEAISRGAKVVTAVELDKTAYETIDANQKQLNISDDQFNLVRANIISWTKRNYQQQFDLVFCDPPYDAVNYASLIKLSKCVRPGGLVIYSLPEDHGFSLPEDNFTQILEKQYSAATLVFFKAIG